MKQSSIVKASVSTQSDNRASHTQDFAIRLLQQMVVPTFVLDSEHRVMIWNRACEQLSGVPAEQVMGTRDHWRAFYAAPRPCLADLVLSGESDSADELYQVYEAPSGQGEARSAENWCVMPNLGTSLYLAMDASPVFDEQGRLIAVIETLRDMTVQKKAEAALEQLAAMDGLTGIANRRHFDEMMEREWRHAIRSREPLALLMCDVDYFKSYNDTYGHQSGDDCLKAIASAIKHSLLRPGDRVARYGGEEFAVILPQSDLASAEQVAQRILDAVRQLAIPHDGPKASGRVTISIGVASLLPERADRLPQLLEAADKALYAAKEAGRDCLQLAPIPAVSD